MGPPSSSFILIHTLAAAPIKLLSALVPIGAFLVTPSFHHSQTSAPDSALVLPPMLGLPLHILHAPTLPLLHCAPFSLLGFKTPPFRTNTSSPSFSYWFTHGFFTILYLYHIFLDSACSACYQLVWLALQPWRWRQYVPLKRIPDYTVLNPRH
jgi:hypothetical protein